MKLILKYALPTERRRLGDEPDHFARLVAVLAVLAWLVLAGDAFGQDNQWAPNDVTPAAPQGQNGTAVWGGARTGDQFAPIDLEQRLADGTANAPDALSRPAAPVPVAADPVYAPPGTATSRLSQPATASDAAQAQAQPRSYGQPYPQSAQMQQGYGNGYGGYPLPGYSTTPAAGGYGQPYPPYTPYTPFGPGGGASYPGLPAGYGTGFPGPIAGGYGPGTGGWAMPYNSYAGLPIFGGSPFGIW